jgi:hypothetical protein
MEIVNRIFLFSFLIITNLSLADYVHETNISVDLVQSINGSGFFSSYRDVAVPDPLGNLEGAVGRGLSGMESKHRAHGSGEINDKSRILAYSYYYEDGVVPVQGSMELDPVIDEENITALPFIQVLEKTILMHVPFAKTVGRWYSPLNPIKFNSLPEDCTYILNLDSGSFLQNKVEYAKALNKKLEASAHYLDVVNTTMDVNEEISEGKVRIRALQVESLPTLDEIEVDKMTTNEKAEEESEIEVMPILLLEKSEPQIEMEEIYQGSFRLKNRMILATSITLDQKEDFWLPCCYNRSVEYDNRLNCTCSPILNSNFWQPPLCFGLNCTQQESGDWHIP